MVTAHLASARDPRTGELPSYQDARAALKDDPRSHRAAGAQRVRNGYGSYGNHELDGQAVSVRKYTRKRFTHTHQN